MWYVRLAKRMHSAEPQFLRSAPVASPSLFLLGFGVPFLVGLIPAHFVETRLGIAREVISPFLFGGSFVFGIWLLYAVLIRR